MPFVVQLEGTQTFLDLPDPDPDPPPVDANINININTDVAMDAFPLPLPLQIKSLPLPLFPYCSILSFGSLISNSRYWGQLPSQIPSPPGFTSTFNYAIPLPLDSLRTPHFELFAPDPTQPRRFAVVKLLSEVVARDKGGGLVSTVPPRDPTTMAMPTPYVLKKEYGEKDKDLDILAEAGTVLKPGPEKKSTAAAAAAAAAALAALRKSKGVKGGVKGGGGY